MNKFIQEVEGSWCALGKPLFSFLYPECRATFYAESVFPCTIRWNGGTYFKPVTDKPPFESNWSKIHFNTCLFEAKDGASIIVSSQISPNNLLMVA